MSSGKDSGKATAKASEPARNQTGQSSNQENGPTDSKRPKMTEPSNGESWMTSYRRVIAILPGKGEFKHKKVIDGTDPLTDPDSSDDEGSIVSEGGVDTSSSSSGFEQSIPFPTKPKVVVKRSNAESQHSHA